MNKDDQATDELVSEMRPLNQEESIKDIHEKLSSSTSNFSRVLVSEDIDNEELIISSQRNAIGATPTENIQSKLTQQLPLLKSFSNQQDSIMQSKSSGSSFERNFNILLEQSEGLKWQYREILRR